MNEMNTVQLSILDKVRKTESQKDLKREWWSWHHKHKEVFELFEAKALELIGKGYKRYSSDGICHIVRWEMNVSRNAEDQFVINNNYTPYMASYFMYLYPQYKYFFETRIRKSETKKPKEHWTK